MRCTIQGCERDDDGDVSRLCMDCYTEMKIDDYPPALTASEQTLDAACVRAERRMTPAPYVAR